MLQPHMKEPAYKINSAESCAFPSQHILACGLYESEVHKNNLGKGKDSKLGKKKKWHWSLGRNPFNMNNRTPWREEEASTTQTPHLALQAHPAILLTTALGNMKWFPPHTDLWLVCKHTPSHQTTGWNLWLWLMMVFVLPAIYWPHQSLNKAIFN